MATKNSTNLPIVITIVVTAVLLGVIVALILTGAKLPNAVLVAAGLVVLGSLGLGLQLTLSVIEGKWKVDFFSPIVYFPLLYGLIYGVGSLVYVNLRETTISQLEYSLYFAGLLSFYAGVILAYRWPWKRKSFTPWDRRKLKYAIYAVLFFALVGFVYTVVNSGIPIFSQDVELARVEVVTEVGGYISYMTNSFEILIVLLFVYSIVYFNRILMIKYPIWFAILLLSIVVLGSLAARRRLAVPLLVSLLVYNYLHKRVRITYLVLLGILGFILLILIASMRELASIVLDPDLISRVLTTEITRGPAALNQIVEVIPSQFEYLGWSGVLLPVKALAPGKQILLGFILKDDILQRSYRGGGFVPALLGYFYTMFGSVGIWFGLFLMGLLAGGLYRRMIMRWDLLSTILYSYIAIYFIIALRNGFLQLWPVYVIVVFFLVSFFSRSKLNTKSIINPAIG